MHQPEAWAWEAKLAKLAEKQDLLIQLDTLIPWQEFRPILEAVGNKPRKSPAGRKPIDRILLFKMLVLQQLYNLSDEALEYQVHDRISFMQFLHLGFEDIIPDATTVWLFRQQLSEQGVVTELFERFESYLQQAGYGAKGGQILDASLIPVPKQRNRRPETQQLEQGEIPPEWQQHPHKLSQKDCDARWTKKNGVSHFGYKSHISIDVEAGFIRRYAVTDAAVHDSQVMIALLDSRNDGNQVWADSAYRSAAIEAELGLLGFESQIHERAYRNCPLTEAQQASNQAKSQVRCFVEHVFGSWVMSQGGKLLRCVGLQRIAAALGFKNLIYNFRRFVFWEAAVVVDE